MGVRANPHTFGFHSDSLNLAVHSHDTTPTPTPFQIMGRLGDRTPISTLPLILVGALRVTS